MAAEPQTREPETIADALKLLAEIQRQNTAVQQQQLKQTAPRSNQVGPKMSVFNPQGEKDFPMPDLKCEVLMPFPQRPGLHGMTFEEVELMNLIVPGIYPIELNDGSTLKVVVAGRSNRATGALERLSFEGPIDPDTGHPTPLFTSSNKQQFPALSVWLRQIADQVAGEDVTAKILTMKQRQQKVAAFIAAEDKAAALKKGALPISRGE